MSLLRSRTAVHRARFRSTLRLFATLAVVAIAFLVLTAVAHLFKLA